MKLLFTAALSISCLVQGVRIRTLGQSAEGVTPIKHYPSLKILGFASLIDHLEHEHIDSMSVATLK